MATDILEVEWQYAALDTRPVKRWLESHLPAGFTVEAAGTKELDDTYFDTRGWHMNRAGYTCRVRRKGSDAELTLKGMAEARDGMRSRRELNEPLESPDAPPSAAPGPCGAIIRAVAGRNGVQPVFRLQTRRQLFDLSDENGRFGEIGSMEHLHPRRRRPPVRLSRVEVEVEPDAVARAKPFVKARVAKTAWQRQAPPSSSPPYRDGQSVPSNAAEFGSTTVGRN